MNNTDLADLIFPEITDDIDFYCNKYKQRDLPDGAIVTRYAPSPTGFIHMGALYASFIERIFARQTSGVFYLRIEDTDMKRTVENGIEVIIDDLKRFGVEFDEGPISQTEEKGAYGPYIQTKRKEIYRTFVKHLIRQGKAYPCFCRPEDLALNRKMQEAQKEDLGYWGKWAKCRTLSVQEASERIQNGDDYIIRLRSEGDSARKSIYKDLIKGELSITENHLDIVILKSDGYPTYHFAHLVDDTLMRTTHVIRADEWVASLPIHLQLFEMFGFVPPKYAHIPPLMKKEDKSVRKLSKRKDPELAISYYFKIGMPPESIRLYLASIANSEFENWYNQNDDVKIEDFLFSFSKFSGSGAIFDLMKLSDISKNHISRLKAEELYTQSLSYMKEFDPTFFEIVTKNREYTIAALRIDRDDRPKPRKDIAAYSDIRAQIWYLFDELFCAPWETSGAIQIELLEAYLNRCYDEYDSSEVWLSKIKALAPEFGYASEVRQYKKDPDQYRGHMGDICEMLRYLLTAQKTSLNLYSVMKLLGRERIMKRYMDYRNRFSI